jgi:hypothetical protein
MNSPTPTGDLHVIEARRAKLLFLETRFAENRVRVRVDQPGSEDAAAAVDSPGLDVRSFELLRRAHGRDAICNNRD